MQLTEKQLQLCKKNDAQAQQAFYDCFKQQVMGLCRRYSRNKEEAEDIFQETFVRVFRSISQLHSADRLVPWIKKIAVNTAVTYYHKNKRHHSYVDYLDHDGQNDEYELILSHFSDETLLGLINELPDGYRMVFNLYVVEGYDHAEIGALLNISEATSRSQLNRARQTLKNQLKSLGIVNYERYA